MDFGHDKWLHLVHVAEHQKKKDRSHLSDKEHPACVRRER